MPMLDSATVLMPQGTYNSAQSFAPIQVSPSHLPTSVVEVVVQSPPLAAATMALEIATTQAGVYSEITRFTWPAGTTGSKQITFGVNASLAQALNNQAAWLRLSLATTGALTGTAWLTKPALGGVGLASRSYTLDNINVA